MVLYALELMLTPGRGYRQRKLGCCMLCNCCSNWEEVTGKVSYGFVCSPIDAHIGKRIWANESTVLYALQLMLTLGRVNATRILCEI